MGHGLRDYREKRYEEYIFNNLEKIERGLLAIKRQMRIKTRNGYAPVDIFAIDKNKTPVIIEVKIYANESGLSQLQTYMSLCPHNSRGILIAKAVKKTLKNYSSPELDIIEFQGDCL